MQLLVGHPESEQGCAANSDPPPPHTHTHQGLTADPSPPHHTAFHAGASVLLGEVKLAGDVLLGVPSEVVPLAAAGINEGQQPQGRLQVCQQIALRTNARLGGVNVRLAGEPQMVGSCCSDQGWRGTT